MKIPKGADQQYAFYVETMKKCNTSRLERIKVYSMWRSFFLFGAGPNFDENTVNKMGPHIEHLSSLMYSQETTRFSIDLSPSASDLHKRQLPSLIRLLNEYWHTSNADITFGIALTWSFVYGSMFFKLRINRGEIECYAIEPHDIGVLREDVFGLSNQEAFTHSYFMTKSQLEYDLKQIPHPRADEILKYVTAVPRTSAHEEATALDRMVTSQSQPLMVGNVNFDLTSPNRYKPKASEDLLQMYELYVWDDELRDYRIVTIAEPGVVIFDRPVEAVFIKGEHPIIQVCPSPAYDYFYGYSEADRLMPLQRMRNERLEQVRHMLNLQAKPPKFGAGFQGDITEIADTLDTPAGVVTADMPGAKLDNMQPQIPEDLYKEIREIDQEMSDMSGISNVMQGRGEQGVRSQGHAANLARLGSTRAKKRALIVEDQLEKVAHLYMQAIMAYSKSSLKDEQNVEFIANQFTDRFYVKVDAHASSSAGYWSTCSAVPAFRTS